MLYIPAKNAPSAQTFLLKEAGIKLLDIGKIFFFFWKIIMLLVFFYLRKETCYKIDLTRGSSSLRSETLGTLLANLSLRTLNKIKLVN